jgi:hypothetical protein
VARNIPFTSWVKRHLVAILVLAVPAAAVLVGCGGGGGGVTSPRQPGQPTISSSAEFLALLPEGQQGATVVGSAECGRCHGSQPPAGQPQLVDYHTTFNQTIHARVGVGCESCHGPGSAHVADPDDETKILTFPRIVEAAVCSQCHAGVHQEWTLSKHDDQVASPATREPCANCHNALYRVEVAEKGRPAGELQRFSVNRNTAACAVCHNPHRNTGNLSDDGKEVLLRHAVFNADISKVDPGSPPAEYTTFDHTCAECHNGRGADPSDAALERGAARPNMHDSNQFNMLAGISGVDQGSPIRSHAHFNAPGQCSTCHMLDGSGGHTFTVKLDNCVPCHTLADAAARRNAVRGDTEARLLALRNRLERWAQATFGDPLFWEYTALIQEDGKTPPDQSQVPIQIKRARHNYYFILRDRSLGTHNGTYTRNLFDVANANLDQLGVAAASVTNRAYGRAILQRDRERANRADAQEWGP